MSYANLRALGSPIYILHTLTLALALHLRGRPLPLQSRTYRTPEIECLQHEQGLPQIDLQSCVAVWMLLLLGQAGTCACSGLCPAPVSCNTRKIGPGQ